MKTKTDSPVEYLRDYFLLAMPGLLDPNFSQTVVYLCEHTTEGAMGLIINQPLDIPLSQVLEQFDLGYSPKVGGQPLLAGGPVQMDRGFVLHRPGHHNWESTLPISTEISLTASTDILTDIAKDQGPEDLIITLGYAGWGPGQLEGELAENSWLTVPGDASIIFDVPYDQRAKATAAKIGIDVNQLSTNIGHA
jgi:putative transcriptional regulator